MNGAIRIVISALSLALPFAASAQSCTWFSNGNSISLMRPGQAPLKVVSMTNVQAVSVDDADCGIWALKETNLRRYDVNGQLIQQFSLSAPEESAGSGHVATDPTDGSVWMVHAKKLIHRTSTGAVVSTTALNATIKSLVVASDQSVWLLASTRLLQFSKQGTLVESIPLQVGTGDGDGEPDGDGGEGAGVSRKKLIVDSVSGMAWVAIGQRITQLKLSQPDQEVRRISTGERVSIVLDPFSNQVWAAGGTTLRSYDQGGTPLKSIDMTGTGLGTIKDLAFDPTDKSIWVLTRTGVGQFSSDGALLSKQSFSSVDDTVGIIATPPLQIKPAITLQSPFTGAISNDPRRAIVIGYDGLCNGQACTLDSSYVAKYALIATLNNESINTKFSYDAASNQARYIPENRHPEGPNTLWAQAKDGSGQLSNAISSTFTIDTAPPKFLNVSPADGAAFSTPDVLVQGTVDDITATVVLEGVAVAANSHVANNNLVFSIPFRLLQGQNILKLTAVDKAGNSTSQSIRLFLNSVSLSVSSPADGATISDTMVLVTGTYSGPANVGIAVNEVVALIDGNRFFAQVPLQSGSNAINIVAATPDGSKLTKTLNVTRSGAASVQIVADKYFGIAPLNVQFLLQQYAPGTITHISADFNGDGVVDATSTDPGAPLSYTYQQGGIFQAKFIVSNNGTQPVEKKVDVIVEDQTNIDQLLRATWTGFAQALMQGRKEEALSYINPPMRQKYGPVFDALGPHMEQVFSNYSTPLPTLIRSELAEYALIRSSGGVKKMYFLYFLKDEDGIWRIDSM